MEFGIYGVSYKEADADVRDCTAFSDTQKMELYNHCWMWISHRL